MYSVRLTAHKIKFYIIFKGTGHCVIKRLDGEGERDRHTNRLTFDCNLNT